MNNDEKEKKHLLQKLTQIKEQPQNRQIDLFYAKDSPNLSSLNLFDLRPRGCKVTNSAAITKTYKRRKF